MRGVKANLSTRYFVSYLSNKPRLRKWKGSLEVDRDFLKQEKRENLEMLTKNPATLDFDNFITYNFPEVLYSLRYKDLVLCVTHGAIELRRFVGSTGLKIIDSFANFYKVSEVVLDPSRSLYVVLRSGGSSGFVDINLFDTFVNERLAIVDPDFYFDVLAARFGMIAAFKVRVGEKMSRCVIKRFDADGILNKELIYPLDLFFPKGIPLEEGNLMVNLGICSRGIGLALYDLKNLYLFFFQPNIDKTILKHGEIKYKILNIPFNKNRRKLWNTVIFEHRLDPMFLVFNHTSQGGYSLTTFKSGRMFMLTNCRNSMALRSLARGHSFKLLFSEYDPKSRKISAWISTTNEKDSSEALVGGRLRLTV